MRRVTLMVLCAVFACITPAAAEYLEIEASEIATINETRQVEGPRLLVKWILPDSLASKLIDGAAIAMTVTQDTSCSVEVAVCPISRAWSASTVGWEAGWARAGGDFIDSLASPAVANRLTGGKISANVCDAVLDQIKGRRSNFGFILVPERHSGCAISEVATNDVLRRTDARLIIAFRNAR